ncbi:hypothetical protein ACFYKX_11885 [Cytobacillus sp. FJAT-54145]|uniref:Uncharacterized protein n=1 Tax=Cytobacillus spartinae TaxID=3299023 RepID=A0ABW6KDT8_9BACI
MKESSKVLISISGAILLGIPFPSLLPQEWLEIIWLPIYSVFVSGTMIWIGLPNAIKQGKKRVARLMALCAFAPILLHFIHDINQFLK